MQRNHKMRCKPVYNGAWLSHWEIVENKHGYEVEAFSKLLDVWASEGVKFGVTWKMIKKTEHRDRTVTIAAPPRYWNAIVLR